MARKSAQALGEKETFLLLLDQAKLLHVEGIDDILQEGVELDQIDFDALRQEIMAVYAQFGDDYELAVGTDLSCFGLAEAYEAFKDDTDVCVKCDKKNLCCMEIAARSLISQDVSKIDLDDKKNDTGVKSDITLAEEKSVMSKESSKKISEKITEVAASGPLGLINPYRSSTIIGVAFNLLAEKSQSLDSLVLEVQAKFPQKSEQAIRRALHFMFEHSKMFFAIEQEGENLSLVETVIKK